MTKKKPKIDYDEIKTKVDALAAKAKAKTITDEERIELAQKREQLRHHNEDERIKAMAAAIEAGKREALLKVLDANGVKTENQLKEIFRFVKEVRPELLAEAADAPTPEPATEEKGDGATEDAPDPEPEPERKDEEPTPEAGAEGTEDGNPEQGNGEPEDAPKCENCGAVLIEKMTKNGKRFLGCPNWKRGEIHTAKDL